eukprot:267596_1
MIGIHVTANPIRNSKTHCTSTISMTNTSNKHKPNATTINKNRNKKIKQTHYDILNSKDKKLLNVLSAGWQCLNCGKRNSRNVSFECKYCKRKNQYNDLWILQVTNI